MSLGKKSHGSNNRRSNTPSSPQKTILNRTLVAVAVGQALSMSALQAATIVVDDLSDDSIGIFAPGAASGCTLRGAIISANTDVSYAGCIAGSGSDTIVFSSSVTNVPNPTITLGSSNYFLPLPDIESNVTIKGQPGVTINANNTGRVLTISAPYTSPDMLNVTLDNLTLTGGNPGVISGAGEGGGVSINGNAAVTIMNSTITGNVTDADFASGGGIFMGGSSLRLVDSTVSDNQTAASGGGINLIDSASLEVIRSTISDNTAGFNGGGIFSFFFTNITIEDSLISNNEASMYAGGVFLIGPGSVANITNSTISANVTVDDGGGGSGIVAYSFQAINPEVAPPPTTINVLNSTFSENGSEVADIGSGLLAQGPYSVINLENTIVTNNFGFDVRQVEGGTVNADANNLFGDSSKAMNSTFYGGFSPGATDITASSDGTVPTPVVSILGPLSDNGGPSFTHELIALSPAINAGNNANCPSTDQRGAPRDDGECDIGAFESEGLVTAAQANCYTIRAANGNVLTFCL